jgi:guanosine-diphosphatase
MPTVSFPPSITLNSPKSSAGSNSDEDEVEESVEDDLEMASSNTLLGGGSNSMARRGSEKLGTGGGSHPFKALTAKRIAAGAAVILFLIFFFGRSTGVVRSITTPTGSGKDLLIIPAENEAPLAPTLPPSSPQRQKGVGEKKKCTPPPGKKALSYALMVDAGSTGSRLHLYTFSHCDPSPDALPKLEDEGFFTTKPGLSSYAGRPKEAAESLRGLMDHALEGIDPSERACTPIAVKATAGLRMLGEEESGAILKAVESWLRQEFPFQLIDDGVVIMDGRDEGISSCSHLLSILLTWSIVQGSTLGLPSIM